MFAVQLHVLRPRFVCAPPDGRSGPHPFEQLGDVPVVQVVTLSVTPPSTIVSHEAVAPPVPASPAPLDAPASLAPEVAASDDEVPDALDPDVDDMSEPEVVAPDADPLDPDGPVLALDAPLPAGDPLPDDEPLPLVPVDGLLLLLHPIPMLAAASSVPTPTVAIETAFIVASSARALSPVDRPPLDGPPVTGR